MLLPLAICLRRSFDNRAARLWRNLSPASRFLSALRAARGPALATQSLVGPSSALAALSRPAWISPDNFSSMLSIAARAAVDGALWRPGAQPLAHACSCPRAASQSAFSDRRATFWSHASPFYRRNTSVRSLAQASELPPRAPVGAPATTGRTLLVVESNAKAGKIGKFLGDKVTIGTARQREECWSAQ